MNIKLKINEFSNYLFFSLLFFITIGSMANAAQIELKIASSTDFTILDDHNIEGDMEIEHYSEETDILNKIPLFLIVIFILFNIVFWIIVGYLIYKRMRNLRDKSRQ